MSRKIVIGSLAFLFLSTQVELEAAEAPKLASRLPEDAVAAIFIGDFPALAHGKAWLSSLSEAFDGEIAIALLEIPQEKTIPAFVVMGGVNPQKFRSFLDTRLKPILRRNLGRAEFRAPSNGVTEIAVSGSPIAFYAIKDDVLSFSLSEKVVADFISTPLPADETLRANPLLRKILDRTSPKSRSILFVNVKKILDAFGEKIPEQGRAVLKAMGILDIEAVGGYDEVANGAQVGSFILITSGKPRGALEAMQQSPLRHAYQQISDFLDGFQEATGLDFERDLFDALGGEVAVAAAVPESLRIPDAVAFLEVKNREKVEAALARLIPPAAASTRQYKGVAIRTVNLGPVMAAYAFIDRYLVLGTGVPVVESVIDTAKAGPSVADNPAFRSAVERVGEGAHLFYLDMGSAFPLYFTAIRQAVARFERHPQSTPPRWEVIGKLLMSPFLTDLVLAGAIYGDDESVTFRSYSTIRATYNWMATSSVLAGMMLPALSRARESARRAACLSNLKQLVVAEHIYADDHDGKFTKRFSHLYPDYAPSLDIFTCPSARAPTITRKEDIDSLTSYVLRKGATWASPPDEVLIYERLENHRGDGGNVAYVDGHVRWWSASDFQKIVERNQQR